MGRPETDWARRVAMGVLGNGLGDADHHEDSLSVQEAALSLLRRLGASEEGMLIAQGNLAITYGQLGRYEQALQIERDVYFGRLKFSGEEHGKTLRAAMNYANFLVHLERDQEAKAVLRRTTPVARRVLGENNELTLKMRQIYAIALGMDDNATLDDLREAVNTLEDTDRIARRVLGGAHPTVVTIGEALNFSREKLAAREGDDVSSVCEAVAAMTTRGV